MVDFQERVCVVRKVSLFDKNQKDSMTPSKSIKEIKTLDILKTGALSIQVCTNAKRKKDIERLTNEKSLCGTVNSWVLDEKESKRLGQSKVTCANDPSRTHYILYA